MADGLFLVNDKHEFSRQTWARVLEVVGVILACGLGFCPTQKLATFFLAIEL
jgi:hypothetical protein